jgi:hypothetical protein
VVDSRGAIIHCAVGSNHGIFGASENNERVFHVFGCEETNEGRDYVGYKTVYNVCECCSDNNTDLNSWNIK